MNWRAQRIGVIGTGFGAWTAALALKEWRPELDVTVVGPPSVTDEDGATPLILRPNLLPFLHGYLGLDPHRLARDVGPAWTLGFRLERAAHPPMPLPFGEGDLAEAWTHDGGLWRASLAAQLIEADAAPVVRLGGAVRSLLPETPIGYHVERAALLAHLAQRGDAVGVHRDVRALRSAQIADGRVEGLILDDGAVVGFDLYVDAAGGGPLLAALGVPWQTTPSPFRAVASATLPSSGGPRAAALLRPRAEGALLLVSTRHRDHALYLHGEASPEAAEDGLRAALTGVDGVEHRPLSLGRRDACWVSNVFAVGRGYGQVDPLLGADTYLVLLHVTQLLALLKAGTGAHERVNARLAGRWDAARDLAALQHAAMADPDSPFWRAALRAQDLGRLAGADADVRAQGLLSRRDGPPPFTDALVGPHGLDALLLAAGSRPAPVPPRVGAEAWETLVALRTRAAEAALPQAEALALADEDRGLYDDLVHGTESWCPPMVEQLARAAPPAGRSRLALEAWARETGLSARFPESFARHEPRYPESLDIDFGKFLRRVPAVVLRPSTQDELARTMSTLYARGIPFKTRGTGHSNGGQTLLEGGAVIDLRGLDRVVRDDPEAETLTIEGGCLMESAQTWLYRQGRGRWLTNLLMHWRVTMAGSLAVGGFGDTSHLRGTQLMMVERMVVMTPDGARHEVGPGDPLFDYSLGGRGQLGVMTELTLKTERRPGRAVARVVRWPSMRTFLEDAATIIAERRFDLLRGRIIWQPGTVDGAAGNFQDAPRGDEDQLMRGLHGKPSAKLESIDYYVENMKPPSEHWLPATPAVEFALPFDPADMESAVALMDELRARVLGAGLGPYTPLGTSFMVLPTLDTLPLAPVPKTSPLAIMIALRPEMPPADAVRALPAMREIGAWALSRGGKLYLMCVEPETPDFLERQFGAHLAPFLELKRRHDPLGLLNPGLLPS